MEKKLNSSFLIVKNLAISMEKFSGILEVDLAGKRLSKIETLAGSHLMRRILERLITAPSSKCLWLRQERFDCVQPFVGIGVQCPK